MHARSRIDPSIPCVRPLLLAELIIIATPMDEWDVQVFTPKQVVCGVRKDRRTLMWFHVNTGTRESAKLSIASAAGEISCRRWLNSGGCGAVHVRP
ncbi:unnamed protein product [Arctogadus glacialis]